MIVNLRGLQYILRNLMVQEVRWQLIYQFSFNSHEFNWEIA